MAAESQKTRDVSEPAATGPDPRNRRRPPRQRFSADGSIYRRGVRGAVGHEEITLTVAGRAGVPDHATAVVLAVAAVDPTLPSYLTLYPTDADRPVASNLNFTAGRTVANLVTVKLGPDGTITVYNHSGSTHVIADLAGWVA